MQNKERLSNIELLRIISMFMIVLSHYNFHGIISNSNIFSQGSFFNQIILSGCILGKIGVGLFFSITGFFLCQQKKFVFPKKFFSTILFYSLISLVIVSICTLAHVDVGMDAKKMIILIVQSLFTPVTGGVWWFATAYFALVLFCTQINRFMILLNKKGFLLSILCLFVFCNLLGNLGSNLHDLEKAIFYYFIGAYIHLFMSDKLTKTYIYSGVIAICGLFINAVGWFLCHSSDSIVRAVSYIITQINEPIVVASLLYFSVNTCIKSNKIINTFASFTFGVYLFHEFPYTRMLLWNVLLNPSDLYLQKYYFPAMLMSVVLIYVIACFVDWIRLKIFNEKIERIIRNVTFFLQRKCLK
ncbi:MAG: acyltransferase family protein [Elusimicrobia bacterium]|nr:acyltransferase family protein [Elusimicrobiota bacterium]